MYFDDCIEGTLMVPTGDSTLPVNIRSSELVTISQMIDVIEEIAGIKVERTYELNAPVGVRGRNSDNNLVQEIDGWEASIRLADGLERTYSGLGQLSSHGAAARAV
jgi:nucleoside-diphosphate-sugar epimerase